MSYGALIDIFLFILFVYFALRLAKKRREKSYHKMENSTFGEVNNSHTKIHELTDNLDANNKKDFYKY